MKVLIFNPTGYTVVYDDGKDIAPGELLYVEGRHIEKEIARGRLIRKQVPDVMPDDVQPAMYEALRAAFDDAQAAKNKERTEAAGRVRNTDTENARTAQNKEA